MPFLSALLAELARPSTLPPGPLHGAYERAVIGMAHMTLGAAMALVLPPSWALCGAAARAAIVAGYWLAKERGDMRRGGTLADGIEDTACVGLGAWTWHPLAVLAVGGWLMWRGWRSDRP